MPLTKSKLCFDRIKFFGRLNFTYFDTIRDMKSSENLLIRKMFRIFENHKLELFLHHSFRTCFGTKTIYEINMCKSQYKKDLKKTLRFTGQIDEALVNNDNTIFIITVCLFVIFFLCSL